MYVLAVGLVQPRRPPWWLCYMFWMSWKAASISSSIFLFFSLAVSRSSERAAQSRDGVQKEWGWKWARRGGGGGRGIIFYGKPSSFIVCTVYVCCDNLCLTKLITKRKKKKHTLTFNIKWKTKNLFKNESTANTKIKFNTRQLLPSHSPDNFCFSV